MASNPVDTRDLSGQARDLLPKGSYIVVGDAFTATGVSLIGAAITGSGTITTTGQTVTFAVAAGALTSITYATPS